MSTEQNRFNNKSQDGSAMVIAILVMLLMMGFVVLAVSRTNSETLMSSNDAAEARAYAAAEASLESTTREFVDVFERKLTPDTTDVDTIQKQIVPGFDTFTFSQKITKIREATPVILTGGNYSGLYSLR